ncbi:hypothetical protein ND748_22845 [Frankia sp. AiPs1]|nr:hypothetical protein [Frankia sp. AiPs1]
MLVLAVLAVRELLVLRALPVLAVLVLRALPVLTARTRAAAGRPGASDRS